MAGGAFAPIHPARARRTGRRSGPYKVPHLYIIPFPSPLSGGVADLDGPVQPPGAPRVDDGCPDAGRLTFRLPHHVPVARGSGMVWSGSMSPSGKAPVAGVSGGSRAGAVRSETRAAVTASKAGRFFRSPAAPDVRGQHRQRHGAGETLLSVAADAVQTAVLQAVDGRPAGGVGAPRLAERLPAFPDAVRLRQPAPAGHRVGSSIPAGPSRSGELFGPRSKLTTDRSGNRARASPPMGTTTSTSLPSHITEWCRMNR